MYRNFRTKRFQLKSQLSMVFQPSAGSFVIHRLGLSVVGGIRGGSCKVDGTAHYAENYATQRKNRVLRVKLRDAAQRCKITPERQAFLKNLLFVQDYHVVRNLKG